MASHYLLSYLEELHASGRLTAKAVCTISFWGHLAGLDCLEKLALNPKSHSGNFQRHLTKIWNLNDQRCYKVAVPAELRHSGDRGTHSLQTLPIHELKQNDDVVTEDMEQKLKDSKLAPNYASHPIVQEGAEKGIPVIPLSFYLDGVRVGKGSQSVLGFSFQNLLSGKRCLVTALRKSLLCQCGCKGCCTLAAVYSFLSWCLHCMRLGVFPDKRHEGVYCWFAHGGWGRLSKFELTGPNGVTPLDSFLGTMPPHHAFSVSRTRLP